MKKLIAGLLALTFTLSCGITTFADTTKPVVPKEVPITIKVDSKDIKWPLLVSKTKPKVSTPKPYLINSVLMVPVKPIAASVGYKVTTKGKVVTVASGTAKTTFTIGENKAIVNGVEKALQTATVLKSNAVYIPAELISPMFSFTQQDWFADTKTLAVYSQFATQDLWTRLFNSNRYMWQNKRATAYGDYIAPKQEGEPRSFAICANDTAGEKREIMITMATPSYENRQKLKEVFKMAYYTEWEKVYNLYMQVERDEIFEMNYTFDNRAGTYTNYFNERNVRIVRCNGGSDVSIGIGFVGQKYTVFPDNPNRPAPNHYDDLKWAMEKFRLNEY